MHLREFLLAYVIVGDDINEIQVKQKQFFSYMVS